MVAEGGSLLLTKERFCGIIFIDKMKRNDKYDKQSKEIRQKASVF